MTFVVPAASGAVARIEQIRARFEAAPVATAPAATAPAAAPAADDFTRCC